MTRPCGHAAPPRPVARQRVRQESKESSIGIEFRFGRDPACKH